MRIKDAEYKNPAKWWNQRNDKRRCNVNTLEKQQQHERSNRSDWNVLRSEWWPMPYHQQIKWNEENLIGQQHQTKVNERYLHTIEKYVKTTDWREEDKKKRGWFPPCVEHFNWFSPNGKMNFLNVWSSTNWVWHYIGFNQKVILSYMDY